MWVRQSYKDAADYYEAAWKLDAQSSPALGAPAPATQSACVFGPSSLRAAVVRVVVVGGRATHKQIPSVTAGCARCVVLLCAGYRLAFNFLKAKRYVEAIDVRYALRGVPARVCGTARALLVGAGRPLRSCLKRADCASPWAQVCLTVLKKNPSYPKIRAVRCRGRTRHEPASTFPQLSRRRQHPRVLTHAFARALLARRTSSTRPGRR